MTRDELQTQRDHHARLCADLLLRGHNAQALKHAKESERHAVLLRGLVTAA